ncbi:MAG: SOS response-associated peptidase [Cytophagia bacterium]|nr:SOS response-associated peptidase [Cytophagia bacterium]
MCYSVANKLSDQNWQDILEIYGAMTGSDIKKVTNDVGYSGHYFVDVYKDNHPELAVISSDAPGDIQMMRWGVIPSFAKYLEVSTKEGKAVLVHPYDFRNKYTKTANAMVETLQDRPTWRRLYKHKRCILPVTGFFEFYHLEGKKVTYPHYLTLKDQEVYGLACLWDEWVDSETGEVVKSFAIITTAPNEMMSVIHNNPNAHSGPRMPAILPVEEWESWLDGEFTHEDVKKLCRPYPTDGMVASPIRQGLKKRDVNADIPQVHEKVDYPELGKDWRGYGQPQEPNQQSLF